jgi:hypothetical protein
MRAIGVATTHPAEALWMAGADEVVERLKGYDAGRLVALLRNPRSLEGTGLPDERRS